MIGLPINIVAILVYVIFFALFWEKKRDLMSYLLASFLGILSLTASMLALNAFYAIPLYARFANFDIGQIIGVSKYLLTMIVPFNLLEGVIWAVAFWLIYTLLTPVLKRYEK